MAVGPQPPLRPSVGFCLQAKSAGSAGRWFLNMTMHKLVEMPVSYSGQKASKWLWTGEICAETGGKA